MTRVPRPSRCLVLPPEKLLWVLSPPHSAELRKRDAGPRKWAPDQTGVTALRAGGGVWDAAAGASPRPPGRTATSHIRIPSHGVSAPTSGVGVIIRKWVPGLNGHPSSLSDGGGGGGKTHYMGTSALEGLRSSPRCHPLCLTARLESPRPGTQPRPSYAHTSPYLLFPSEERGWKRQRTK